MPTPSLPSRPNSEFYRKQAKALLKSARQGDAAAIERMRRWVPRLNGTTGVLPVDIALHEAQLAVARENGFASWPLFHAQLPSGESGRKFFRPHVRGFQWYEERVAGVVSVHHAGMPEAIETIRKNHPKFANASDAEILQATFTDDDARLVLAREHGFESWNDFKAHIEAIESGKKDEPFTAAFDAIKTGNVAGFRELLREHPDLVNAQGTNGSTLLNLAGSLRQKAICQLLIEHGADVDLATTRGVTPLHQAAYSNQPDLIEMLIEAGASPQMSAYGDGGTPLTMALFWGHNRARETLARYAVVPDNLRVAAGAGREDLVKACFTTQGGLTAEATAHRGFYRPHTGFPVWNPSPNRQEVLDEALTYASRNGQVQVLKLLLSMGADINGDPYRGTALIWAVCCKRVEVIEWLLDHGADINRRATFGGPGHGQGITALHSAAESGRTDLVKLLIARGADPGIRDDLYHSTPMGWAEHSGHVDVKEYLQQLTPG